MSKTRLGRIYCATCKVNGKQYVGKTIKKFKIRKRSHKTDAYSSNQDGSYKIDGYFQRAIRKHGFESFEWEVLEDNVPENKLDAREIYWIAKLGTFGNGYNSTKGGEGASGYKHSEESKKKKSRPVLQIDKITGNIINSFFGTIEAERITGINHSSIGECCRKNAKSAGGYAWRYADNYNPMEIIDTERVDYVRPVYKIDKSTGQIIARYKSIVEAGRKNKIFTNSISACCRGKLQSTCGYIWRYVDSYCETESIYIDRRHRKAVFQIDKTTKQIISEYPSIKEAGRILSIRENSISACCKEKRKSAGGYVWRYKDNYDATKTIDTKPKRKKMRVLQIDKTTGRIISEYSSLAEASRIFKLNSSGIIQCCKGNQKTAGGYIWKYVDNEEVQNG